MKKKISYLGKIDYICILIPPPTLCFWGLINHRTMRRKLFFLFSSLLLTATGCASKAGNPTTASSSNYQDSPTTIVNPSNPEAVPATVFPVSSELNGHDAFAYIKKSMQERLFLSIFGPPGALHVELQ